MLKAGEMLKTFKVFWVLTPCAQPPPPPEKKKKNKTKMLKAKEV